MLSFNWEKALLCAVVFVIGKANAQETPSAWQALIARMQQAKDTVGDKLPEVAVEPAVRHLVDEMPPSVKTAQARFITLSVENDKFGNGTDKDYTNGLRLTYYNTATKQPFYVQWIDRLVPAYEHNESSNSYFSFGHNLYSPKDITEDFLNREDRPYAAFLYASAGVNTLTYDHVDNVELTLGWVGPSALGEPIQKRFHKLIGSDTPSGWRFQLKDEPALMLSWERSWPQYWAATIENDWFVRFAPHVGLTLGNVYTYANAGFTIDLTPKALRWQTQPVRVRPAIPGSGYFERAPEAWSWMVFFGWDTRLMGRNLFLDGNTFKESHRVGRQWWVHDAALGATASYDNWRASYTLNWRSKEFHSPLADDQVFGSLSLTYQF